MAIDLVTRFPEYKKVLGRHGIKLNRDRLIDQLQEIVEGSEPRFFESANRAKKGTPSARSSGRRHLPT